MCGGYRPSAFGGIRVKCHARRNGVKTCRAIDSSVPTPLLQGRISELSRQSKKLQAELARVTEELDHLQCQTRHSDTGHSSSSLGYGRKPEGPKSGN